MRSRAGVILVVLVASTLALAAPASAEVEARRTAGVDRYATAAALSRLSFPQGAAVAYVATGTAFADALAGGPAAAADGGPVLLTARDALPAATADEVRRLGASRVVLLGGTAAVSAAVEAELAAIAGDAVRIAGGSRYDTAARLATAAFDPGIVVAYVASGEGFADALAGGAAAGHLGGPVLLTEAGAVPPATADALRALAPDAIRVLGGPGAVADAVVAELRGFTPDVDRLAGADRYSTAALVSADAFDASDAVFVATGASFADALAAGAAAAAMGAPLLLSQPSCLSPSASDEIDRLDPETVHLVGGEAALGPAVAALRRCDEAAPPPARSLSDRPDDLAADRWQVHVMYVLPSDGTDRGLDTDGAIDRSVSAFQTWLAERSGGTRIATDTYQGALDVTFHRLGKTDSEIAARGAYVRTEVEALIADAGFDEERKLYAVYYDGSSTWSCGGGAWPPELVGRAAVMYLNGKDRRIDDPDGTRACARQPVGASATQPGYTDIAMLHEIVHTLGVVATCAPNHTRSGHVSDSPADLMYSGEEPWRPTELDIGNDDYWGHGRADCLDLARSAFLDPLPSNAQPPPAWP